MCNVTGVTDGRDGGWDHKYSRKQFTELAREEEGVGDIGGCW